ncbi:hypothetical protein BH09BAC2_BH09BAC2_22060 [soil metagenome]
MSPAYGRGGLSVPIFFSFLKKGFPLQSLTQIYQMRRFYSMMRCKKKRMMQTLYRQHHTYKLKFFNYFLPSFLDFVSITVIFPFTNLKSSISLVESILPALFFAVCVYHKDTHSSPRPLLFTDS